MLYCYALAYPGGSTVSQLKYRRLNRCVHPPFVSTVIFRTLVLANRSVNDGLSILTSRGSIPEIYMSLRMRHMAAWAYCD